MDGLALGSQAVIHRLRAGRLEIERDEPPVLRVLDSICHSELLRATGYDRSQYVEIAWYQRLLAQFVDVREHAISPR